MKTRGDILPEIERQVFRTITDADWAREIRAARARVNVLRERIAAAAVSKNLAQLKNQK